MPGAEVKRHEWIIEGLLTNDGVYGWIGPEKAEKSLFALRLAMHIACGKDWYSYKVPKPRKVVYFDAENPKADVDERYRDLLSQFTSAEQVLIRENLIIFQARELINEGLNIEYDNKEFWEEFVKLYPADVYFLDSLYMLHSKAANDNEGLKHVLIRLRRIFGQNKCVIPLHHTHKRSDYEIGGKPVRLRVVGIRRWSDKCYGGGVFKKFAEGIIGQERDEEKDEQGNVLSWSIDFQAYGRPIEDTPVLRFVEDGVTKYSRTLWRELAPSAKESLAKLQRVRGPWKSKNEAARVLGISRSQGNLHINELISKMYLTVSENEGVALT